MKEMLLCAVIGFVIGALFCGWLTRNTLNRMKEEHMAAVVEQQQKARKLEQDMAAEKDRMKDEHNRELQKQKSINDTLRRDIRNGRLRLSVNTRSCTMPANTVAGSGKGRAELDAEVAERLVDIADQGDVAIRKLNYCIDRYNAARDALREQF